MPTTKNLDRRRDDAWALPSTLAGFILILASVALFVFTDTSDAIALALGVLGGILVRGESVLSAVRSAGKPKL